MLKKMRNHNSSFLPITLYATSLILMAGIYILAMYLTTGNIYK